MHYPDTISANDRFRERFPHLNHRSFSGSQPDRCPPGADLAGRLLSKAFLLHGASLARVVGHSFGETPGWHHAAFRPNLIAFEHA